MKISFMKGFFALGSLMTAIGAAADDKGKITLDKGILALQAIAPSLGLALDPKQAAIASIAIDVITRYGEMTADKKITVSEALKLVALVCKVKGIDFDEVGFKAANEFSVKSLSSPQ